MKAMNDEQLIEAMAKDIDPEAFGLPENADSDSITDRDYARDHARAALATARAQWEQRIRDRLKEMGTPMSYEGIGFQAALEWVLAASSEIPALSTHRNSGLAASR